MNRRFGGTYRFYHQGDKNQRARNNVNSNYIMVLRSLNRLLVTAKCVPSWPILVTLMMEAIRSPEASVLARSTRRHIPEDDILHSHRPKNLKSYTESAHSHQEHPSLQYIYTADYQSLGMPSSLRF
jgi:hypothetical protein